jgi:O-antigen ligase
VKTESRGGVLAAAAAAICALALFRRRRMAILGLVIGVALLAAAWLAINPGALARITSVDSGGDGRSDLWTIALRVWHDHRVFGVGLNNFIAVAGHYVNRPGGLTSVALIVTHPHVVHNTYLEALTDTGVVGFVLLAGVFSGLVTVAVRAGWRAEIRGLADVAVLARSVAVAIIAVLVALFFLSDAQDPTLWVLFALAPITFRLAYLEPRPAAPAPELVRRQTPVPRRPRPVGARG